MQMFYFLDCAGKGFHFFLGGGGRDRKRRDFKMEKGQTDLTMLASKCFGQLLGIRIIIVRALYVLKANSALVAV